MKRLLLPLTLALLLTLATSCTEGKKDPAVTAPSDGTAATAGVTAPAGDPTDATEAETAPAGTAAPETERNGDSPATSPAETTVGTTVGTASATTSDETGEPTAPGTEKVTEAPLIETTPGGIVLPRDEF